MVKGAKKRHISAEYSRRKKRGTLWTVSLIALGAIAFVFCTFEIVERLWLTEIDMGILHVLHVIRGIGSSVIVGFLVGWYILRKGGSIFPVLDAEASQLQEAETVGEKRIIHFNLWFIKMRWLACTVSIALVVITIKALGYLEERVFWPLLLSVAVLVASNIIYTLLLRRRLLIWYLREMQIVSDLAILTVMLHFSGGIENPLFLTYIFHVIIGGILLDRRKCYAIVIIASVLFVGMALLEMTDVIEHYTLIIFPHAEHGEELEHAAHKALYVWSTVGLQFMIMSLTAYFTTSIMDRLRSEERNARVVGQRLKRVLEASGSGFIILDKQLRPLWLNRQISQWLGLSEETSSQSPGILTECILTEWIGGEKGPAVETFKDGRVRIVERQRIDPEGNKRFFQITVAPLLDSTGGVYQIVELTQDITQQKLLEAEMMHSSRMAALGVMAAGVAHEVGNPLASISTRLRLMKEEHDEDFVQESIGLLENEISRISRILHGVSQLARPVKAEWSTCRINSIISATLNILRLDRRVKDCTIQADLSEAVPETTGSRDELSQVFLNLGLNALEKMPHGGTLTVRTTASRGEIKVSFADTGEGMSKDVLSKIFTPFYTTKEDGLGLGLYISQSIINAHGGRIEVQSKLNVGTTIAVVLPVRAAKV